MKIKFRRIELHVVGYLLSNLIHGYVLFPQQHPRVMINIIYILDTKPHPCPVYTWIDCAQSHVRTFQVKSSLYHCHKQLTYIALKAKILRHLSLQDGNGTHEVLYTKRGLQTRAGRQMQLF